MIKGLRLSPLDLTRLYRARVEGGVKVADGSIVGDGLKIRSLTVRNNGDVYTVRKTNCGSSGRREQRSSWMKV